MGWARVAFGFGMGLALGCQSSGQAFECTTNEQCGADGTCQPTGYCSFPDTTCPSEQRYGSLAGDRLADTCVPESDSSTSDGSTSSVAMTTGSSTTTGSTTESATESTSVATVDTGTTDPSGPGSSESSSSDGTGGPDPLGPVVWYRFDQVEGGVVPDASGNGIDGSCASCGDVVMGMVDSGLEFSEVQNIVLADHDPVLENDQVTVSAWLALYSQMCMSIASKPVGGEDRNSWQLYTCNNMRGSMDLVALISGAREHYFVATYEVTDAEFVHVAMTCSDEIVRLYVDGVQELSMQLEHEMVFDDSPLIVGGEDNGEGLVFPFQGVIDELRVYTRALTEDEIAELFASR